MKNKLNRQKIKVSKRYKKLFITFLTILISVNIVLIIAEAMHKEVTEETQIASSFSNTPGISYQVFLKENALFEEPVMSDDIGYFSAFIDHIEVAFNNQYHGVNGAEYKGDYTVTGEITGWEGGSDTPVPAWTKQFVISPKKSFNTTDDKLIISQSAKIDYNHFNSFVAEIGELTGYNTIYSMKIIMTVNYTITTSEGDVSGSIHPALMMPLGESYFKFVKSGIEEMKNDITKTVEVPVPVDYIKICLFSTISLLCLILLVLFLSSAEPTMADIQRKRVGKILKSHGNRLVAVNDNIVITAHSICNVHSMPDMVKISDEIEQPILYVFQNDLADIKEFFLFEYDKAYLYQVSDNNDKGRKKTDSVKSDVSTESGDGSITAAV